MYRALITLQLAHQDTQAVTEHWRTAGPLVEELGRAIEAWWAIEQQYSTAKEQDADAP